MLLQDISYTTIKQKTSIMNNSINVTVILLYYNDCTDFFWHVQ